MVLCVKESLNDRRFNPNNNGRHSMVLARISIARILDENLDL